MIPYFFYGNGMYRKHPNHTYGRNRNNSAYNQAYIFFETIACFTNLACGLLIIQIHGDKIEFVMKKKCKL